MDHPGDNLRKFNRFEIKYLITLRQAEKFKHALRAYMAADNIGSDDGRYSLTSLYYDSPDLCCFWEKEYGIRLRRKLRIRRYETGELVTEDTPVFLEIKQRVDRVTQKRRARLAYGQALQLCNDRQIPEHDAEDKGVIEEAYAFLWQYNLRPVSIVRYERQAFAGSVYDTGLRVTFDTNLRFQPHPLNLHEAPIELPMLPANWTVMEIKVNDRIPAWLTALIASHNLRLERISKYCRSITAARHMPAIRCHHLPAESAQDALATCLSIYHPCNEKIAAGRQ